MAMILVSLLIVIYTLHGMMSLWSFMQLRRFLADTPVITDEACLMRYKALVRTQMYLALGSIVVLLGGILLGLIIITWYGCMGFIFVMAANGYVLGTGLFLKHWEQRARQLPSGSEALAQAHRAVSEAWVKKPFPDF
jgi:hypothetical protein